MNSRLKVAVLTGTRAEYDLLYCTLRRIDQDPDMALQLVVTGSHLLQSFGHTVDRIIEDGFKIHGRIDCVVTPEDDTSMARSFSMAAQGLIERLAALKPDILLLLGDRYEVMAAASIALLLQIPIAHIHGGEITEGAIDDSIRHAVTKMTLLHFTATEEYRKRVIQMGEDPARVWNVGAPGLENILQTPVLSKKDLEDQLKYTFPRQTILVTFHPETRGAGSPSDQLEQVFESLDTFDELGIIFTAANADAEGEAINKQIAAYAKARGSRVIFVPSLGRIRYLSALHQVNAVVGNSSSGIIEAPFVPVPTVNIGDRQKGRARSQSIIDCPPSRAAITESIQKVLSPKFRVQLDRSMAAYGIGETSSQIVSILKSYSLHARGRKNFHDLGQS